MNLKLTVCFLISISLIPVFQQKDIFHAGSVIADFGKVATVDSDMELNAATKLMLCFDAAETSGNSINQTFNSAARFINLNAESGADAKNVSVAIVVHGSATMDVTNAEFYSAANKGKANPNAAIIAELQKNRTTIYLCGQTAAWRGISKADLIPGVKMAPSAMTAHALLQQDGFALCPF